MIRRPPRSPLSPYRTLFRSRRVGAVTSEGDAIVHADAVRGLALDGTGVRVGMNDRVAFRRQDRKSTRLNSSHTGISYAVFCLKKKKHRVKTSLYHTHQRFRT